MHPLENRPVTDERQWTHYMFIKIKKCMEVEIKSDWSGKEFLKWATTKIHLMIFFLGVSFIQGEIWK
jgi:hypothetical protein